ncbi:sigma-54-dependent transcriptional regulator [Piscinibacter sp.]|uniref:sigma-54-dependent transcriptional regulator n=1 Tax=Piscinibacter sp. TaxID=1903157 RepID=UPI002C938CC5|nr:sigma-54 dependent transcriptional regulator [Albitalea sp.]HUG23938.1 sigma-54 dependent transcriptional regulator [Albitalea sp.]
MRHVLVVDDERDSAETLAVLVAGEGFTVATAGSLKDARRQMVLQTPDLVLLDLVLPDGNGLRLVEETRGQPNTEIVLVTGHGDVESSIQALRLGASDYLLKPIDTKQLQEVLARVSRPGSAASRRPRLAAAQAGGQFGSLLGRSAAMQRVYDQIARAAPSGVAVLITGESGSGKELVACTLHELSRRAQRPLLAVNCGAISPNLMESEIFGHEKGSFTGADSQHIGFFERASGGTLFLDEITEMPPELQVKLLRVLETGAFMRVGSTQVQTADVRLVAATNRDPERAVRDGKLREDLLYRLNVFPIHVPPLRDRAEDVPLLAAHFLDLLSHREGGAVKRFAPQALECLSGYRWPGNVRELRNVVERAYVMAPGREIVDASLPSTPPAPVPEMRPVPDVPTVMVRVGASWSEIEREVTLATLKHYKGHHQHTCHALGVSVKTLYNRLKEWQVRPAA